MKLRVKKEGIAHLSERTGKQVTLGTPASFKSQGEVRQASVLSKIKVIVGGEELKMTFLEIVQNFEVIDDE